MAGSSKLAKAVWCPLLRPTDDMNKKITQFSSAVALLLASIVLICSVHGQPNQAQPQRANCVNNLKMIDLALRVWEGNHNDDFPWNVSTNAGGVKELIGLDENNLITNAWRVFEVMSNELSDPAALVCSNDIKKAPARDFGNLTASNVTYRIHVIPTLTPGQTIDLKSPLIICPTDGNVLYYDESIKIRKL
jgi:hypothetical protein